MGFDLLNFAISTEKHVFSEWKLMHLVPYYSIVPLFSQIFLYTKLWIGVK